MSKNVRRLFEQFQPSNYALFIHPSSEKMTFEGKVVIKGRKTGRPSQRLTFHQKDLKVSKATITKGGKAISVSRINLQKSYDELRLHTDDMLYPGEYEVTLEFSGEITRPMHGLYPCFFEHDGKKKILLATQFESHHAREVFPCIDEPEAKATFDLTIKSPADGVVLANTPILKQEKSGKHIITSFETTPVMSTYLLAFAIGEIHCVEASTKDGVTMRTWATVAQPEEMMRYANDEAVKILEFFTEYFQTPFPLKKCDQIALPDFESAAMENWGLITYREIALLADPVNRSQLSEQYVSMVVAHELSHQWFGNLVTMKWWDDLWLNESFASLMEHIALDALHPDWHQWEQYTASDVISCSARDIFKDVQSVHVDVHHPDEIGTLFDPAIVYAKGGRLLKMTREYIGDQAFRDGLKDYFRQHAYKNTIGDDLWAAMSASSGKNIKEFMDPWLDQSGMPVLQIRHLDKTIEVAQKRFVLDKDNDKSLWPVPLLASQPLDADILTERTMKLARPADKVVILNQNGSGHMLVHYVDEPTRQYIADSFSSQELKPESRVNILNDMFLLARKGDAPLTDALDIIAAASSEPRDAVWMMISRTIGAALGLTEGDDTSEKHIKAFRAQLVRGWYDNLGWDDQEKDDPNTKALRQTILSMIVASDNAAAVDEAVRRYKEADSAADLPSEQRAMIIGAAVKAGEDIVEELIELYKTTPNPDLQLSVCAGLTNIRDQKKGAQLVELSLGENGFVRPQDIFRWYAYLMRNRHTRRATWEWLKTSWGRLEDMFGDSKSFEYFVVYSAGPINTADMQKEFVEFFSPKENVVALRRNIKIAYSEIEARVAWRQREEENLKIYFKSVQ